MNVKTILDVLLCALQQLISVPMIPYYFISRKEFHQ